MFLKRYKQCNSKMYETLFIVTDRKPEENPK